MQNLCIITQNAPRVARESLEECGELMDAGREHGHGGGAERRLALHRGVDEARGGEVLRRLLELAVGGDEHGDGAWGWGLAREGVDEERE